MAGEQLGNLTCGWMMAEGRRQHPHTTGPDGAWLVMVMVSSGLPVTLLWSLRALER